MSSNMLESVLVDGRKFYVMEKGDDAFYVMKVKRFKEKLPEEFLRKASVVSKLVAEAAAKHKIPEPEVGEEKQHFMSRCISNMMKETDKEQDQCVAICFSQWRGESYEPISPKDGVVAVQVRNESGVFVPAALLFDKKKWDEKKIAAWIREHGFVVLTENFSSLYDLPGLFRKMFNYRLDLVREWRSYYMLALHEDKPFPRIWAWSKFKNKYEKSSAGRWRLNEGGPGSGSSPRPRAGSGPSSGAPGRRSRGTYNQPKPSTGDTAGQVMKSVASMGVNPELGAGVGSHEPIPEPEKPAVAPGPAPVPATEPPETTQAKEVKLPKLKLVGRDGNAFAILAFAREAARKAKMTPEKWKEIQADATSGDYNHLLQVMMKNFDIS